MPLKLCINDGDRPNRTLRAKKKPLRGMANDKIDYAGNAGNADNAGNAGNALGQPLLENYTSINIQPGRIMKLSQSNH